MPLAIISGLTNQEIFMYRSNRHFRFICLALMSLAGFGCAPAAEDGALTLEDGFEDALTNIGGCADILFYAVDEADEVMLSFSVGGLLQAANEAGEEQTTGFELPSDGLTLIVEVGEKVSDATCDDVIENGGPQVVRTYKAISGTAQITARPGEDEDYSHASGDLLLENVEFESTEGGAENITLDDLEILDASVGWYAG
jgi:hypothetical protein